jgi:hypothetical protein
MEVKKGLKPTLKDPTSLTAFISFCSYYISDKHSAFMFKLQQYFSQITIAS